MKITHDLHLHTYLSSCCHDKENMVVNRIIEAAHSIGLATIGFSDHVWMNPAIEPSPWYKPQDAAHIERLRDDIAAADSRGIKISFGCEADMRAPGQYSITPEYAATLDHVLLSCSHFHMTKFVEQPEENTPAGIGQHLIKFFVDGVNSGLATSIAHPFMPVGNYESLDAIIGSISDSQFSDACAEAAANSVALEITLGFLPKTQDDGRPAFSLETPVRMITLAKEAGCKFTFGSDAHDIEKVIRLPRLQYFIEKCQLTENDICQV